jgi:hypothetical protein
MRDGNESATKIDGVDAEEDVASREVVFHLARHRERLDLQAVAVERAEGERQVVEEERRLFVRLQLHQGRVARRVELLMHGRQRTRLPAETRTVVHDLRVDGSFAGVDDAHG